MHPVLDYLYNWFFKSEMSVIISRDDLKGPPAYVLTVCFLWFASLVWGASDARSRGKSAILAILFVGLANWPLSILFWLWLRPQRAVHQGVI